MDDSVVSVQGLIKRYGTITIVDNISFEVNKSEIFGLLGPNGAGKTTTLECLEGICKSDGGTLCVNGCNSQLDRHKLHQTLGVQLQSSSLLDGIRPGEAMSLICSWHGLLPRFDLLRRFGIDYQNKKQYSEMSTGQKRRLHLALGLSCDPAVIILDDPTAGLDVQGVWHRFIVN